MNSIFIHFRFFCLLICCSQLCPGTLIAQISPSQKAIVSLERIWDRAPHNAFTDLTYFQEAWYCTFREGTGHVPGTSGTNGTIRVIRSSDGHSWESVALLDEYEVDLRDPKLSITPDGRILITMGGSFYAGKTLLKREPRVSFSDSTGRNFSAPVPVEMPISIRSNDDWLWRLTWDAGIAYGVVYQAKGDDWPIHLVKSEDGLHFEYVSTWEITGKPNETTLRFLPDGRMQAIVRREGEDQNGYWGESKAPYTDWAWESTQTRLGGPNFIHLPNGNTACATRAYLPARQYQTVIGNLDSKHQLSSPLALISGGDTSYPGLVLRDDLLYVSYYSSHEGKSAIYLARIRWKELK